MADDAAPDAMATRVIRGSNKARRLATLRDNWRRKKFKHQNGVCAICNTPMLIDPPKGKLRLACTLDHIVALSKGGGDHWENVQAVHDHCNQAKGDA